MLMKIGIGDKEMDMVEGMAVETKISSERPMGGPLLKLKHTTPPQREASPIKIHHLEELVVDRETVMGMVKIRMIRIKEDIEIPSMILRKKMRKRVILKILLSLKFTPQQLSQVTPGGGVLKLTLSKKGPLKMTTEAQSRRPDPSKTTVKTVYDPTNEKDPLQGGENIKAKTTSRRGESLRNPKIKPRKAPNDKEGESFPEDGGPVRKTYPGSGDNFDGNGGPDRGKKPPRKGKGPLNGFRRIDGDGGGSDPSDDD